MFGENKAMATPESTVAEMSLGIQFFNSIIEDVNVWLNVLDDRLNIILWNATAERLSGYLREEVMGHAGIWTWLYPDEAYRRKIVTKVEEICVSPDGLENFETEILCKNGRLRIISWNSRSLLNEAGRVYGVITFGYDITERRRAREALQKAHDELSVLYDIASVASRSIELNTILESSLDRVLPTMKSKKGTIHLWDAKTGTLNLAAHRGLSPSAAAQLEWISLDDGLISRVFEQSRPVKLSNLTTEFEHLRSAPVNLLHTYLGAPMRAKGRVLGVISVFGKTGHEFSPEQVTLLASIADQIGVAVENARLYQEASQLAVMEERRRLARDLHDSVTQSLFSLTLFAEAGQRLLKSGELHEADKYLTWLSNTAQDALKEMRLLVYELRPLALEPGGLVEAIQQRLNAVERRAGIKAHLMAGQNLVLPQVVEEGLYYLIQEALNNALKHACATSVTVRLEATGAQLISEVIDDGIGFDPAGADHTGGLGLVSMRERAERLGGQFHITAAPGEGTKITVCIQF